MAGVERESYAQVGNRRVKTKAVRPFMEALGESIVEAGAIQLRILADESRDLLLDKLFALRPARPATAVVERPARSGVRSDIPTSARRPFRSRQHPPLKPRTVADKARRVEDGRKLIATGEYVEAIKVNRHVDPSAGVYYTVDVGEEIHGPSGFPMAVLAGIHEFGSADGRVPPRPHWRPTQRALVRRARQMGADIQADAIRRAFRAVR